MCSPVAGVMVGAAVLQTFQQQQEADAMVSVEKTRHRQETKRAQRDAEVQQNMLHQQALEESTALQQERESLALERLREQASIKVSSAESGVAGVSPIRSFLASNIRGDSASNVLDTNERNSRFRNQMEQVGINTNYSDRVNASASRVADAKRQRVGFMDYAVNVGTAGAMGYALTPSASAGGNAFTSGAKTGVKAGTPSKGVGIVQGAKYGSQF